MIRSGLAGFAAALLVVAAALYFAGAWPAPVAVTQDSVGAFTCSMHPQVLENRPGPCPICGMQLVAVADDGTIAQRPGEIAGDPHTCAMHPQVVQEGPGACPICGMALVPVTPESRSPGEDSPEGVRVSPAFRQAFAVRTAEVVRDELPSRIRTVGFLDQNEERVVSVTTKFTGWIERARVNSVGERVSKGDLLFEIHSPELLTAQNEYVAAIGFVERLKAGGAYAGAVERAESLLQAAADRLEHWDLTVAQIAELRTARRARRTVEFYSPAEGFVVEKVADSLEGIRLVPGMTVLKIADHSTLWAKVEFYERYLRDLRVGLPVDIAVDAFPARSWRGHVLFFRPAMNPQTQTLTGYIEVDNSEGLLRPNMYATMHVRLPGARNALIVPSQSVLSSGDRAVVIVDEGGGLFAPREVELGLESDGRTQVLRGLEQGELVVTSSQFLLDSESNLRVAIARLLEGRGREAPQPGR